MGGTKKGIYIFAGTILSLFAITTVYFAASVAVSLKKGPLRAENDFKQLSTNVNSALFFDVHTESAREFQNKTLANKYIAALLVRSGKTIVFAYPSVSNFIVPDAGGLPTIKTSSPFIKVFSTPVGAASNAVLTAAVYTLHPSDIYNPARLSFLIVLGCTLAVFAALLFLAKSPQSVPEEKTQIQDVFPFRDTPAAAQTDTAADILQVVSDTCDTPDGISEYGASQNNRSDKENVPYAAIQNAAPDNIEYGFDKENTGAAETALKPENKHISDPTGLFSPTTGVGWESYMETRLDSELVRAASSEQDLALVLLRIRDLENNALMMKRTAAVLLDFFKFRDFVFEYKKDGFAGILLNIGLDQTMELAQTMYSQLKELLESENIRNKLAMGISTRSLRLLPGSRLITEADKALEKAFDEPRMPIVAFRVNPDKYRQFVADSERQI